MKCLIHCPATPADWIANYFPDTNPYLLRIANKPYLEYLLDYCVLCGVKSLVIAAELGDGELQETLGNGEKWGIAIRYSFAPPGVAAEELLPRLSRTLAGEDLLVFSGMFWLNYNIRAFEPPLVASSEAVRYGRHCLLLGAGARESGQIQFVEKPQAELGIEPFYSIRDFYHRSMALLKGDADHYAMPTYSNTPNVYIGQNVSLARTADILAPVHFGNVIQIAEHTSIGPNVIIGDNSFVDTNTVIRNSVIQGNTYIGTELEILGKIVSRGVIINPESGEKLDINDADVLTQIARPERPRCSYLQQATAILLLIAGALPFLILKVLLRPEWEGKECFLTRDEAARIWLLVYLHPSRIKLARWFRKLSLDRYPNLRWVIRGKLRLVGSKILEANEENRQFLKQFPDYAPGLFSYSEMLGHDRERLQMELDELYYAHHISFMLNCKILSKTLVHNLLKED